ncbi:hypothetical protein SISNIDRAFT_448146 [Sistotremastrum niveocremeum HHB9708]|uniref:Uncharacterized protein n=2 Tax=Sistotremastraceae TaxID=3402574 RepID=A0A165AMC4_9AGAM|nr:hypothetical protein SISNIDRAFT_448146 [Sistotremastrum niveocremeum HHB9708]KZT42097.1 hypothetical protein SISSUDRAFT_1042039 [Sistotremastrum suecicum HHB10207 ss-3]
MIAGYRLESNWSGLRRWNLSAERHGFAGVVAQKLNRRHTITRPKSDANATTSTLNPSDWTSPFYPSFLWLPQILFVICLTTPPSRHYSNVQSCHI